MGRSGRWLAIAFLSAVPAAAHARGPLELRGLGGYRALAQKADQAVLDGAPAYGAALDLGVLPWATLEAAYVGTTFRVAAGQPGAGGRVMQNDAWLALKLGPRTGVARPYLLGGAGWTWWRSESTGGPIRNQDYLVAPVGAGIDFALGERVLLGIRGAWEFGFQRKAVSSASPSPTTDELLVAAEIGAAF